MKIIKENMKEKIFNNFFFNEKKNILITVFKRKKKNNTRLITLEIHKIVN